MSDFRGFPIQSGERNPTYSEFHGPQTVHEKLKKFANLWIHRWELVEPEGLHRTTPSSQGNLHDFALSEGWVAIGIKQAYHMGQLKLRSGDRKFACVLTTSSVESFSSGWFWCPAGGPLRVETVTQAKDLLSYPWAMPDRSEPPGEGSKGSQEPVETPPQVDEGKASLRRAVELLGGDGAMLFGSKVELGDGDVEFLTPPATEKRARAHLELFHRWTPRMVNNRRQGYKVAHAMEHSRGARYRRHRHVSVSEILDVGEHQQRG